MTEASTQLSPLSAARLVPVAVPGTVVRTAAPVLVLAAVAGLALVRWWRSGDAVPLSWVAPPAELVVLLPVVPVVGLLLLGATAQGAASAAERRRSRFLAGRWAAAAAVVVALWCLGTAVDLYGDGLRGLLGADNLPAVLAASAQATAQVLLVWVLALVALLGGRVERRGTGIALALLVAASALAAAPSTPVVHGHADAAHTLVHTVAGIELVALLAWVGLQLAPLLAGSTALPGVPQALACAALGLSIVVAAALRPDAAVPVGTCVARGVLVLVVVAVGLRHRTRAATMVAPGPRQRLVLVGGDCVVVLAVVLLAAWLPLAG